MSGTDFPFARCPMKHYVRTHAWLPLCRRRLNAIRAGHAQDEHRGLRYFSFCAIEAVDVLMLDLARIIRPRDGRFDTVYFFTRVDEALLETRKNIPGANGFAGEFVEVVLVEDLDDPDAVEVPRDEPDTRETRARIQLLRTQRSFRASFPFDVINLDLERYLFRPLEVIPGDLIRALRKVFEWQKRTLRLPNRRPETINGFSLMFTTKVGPENMGGGFLRMLTESLEDNVTRDPELARQLLARTGLERVPTLIERNFDAFFTLAAPKIIAKTLWETDWYIDPDHGIDVYAFQRTPPRSPPYTMLHLVMDVRRQDPPMERRPPGQTAPEATRAYPVVIRSLFTRPAEVIREDAIDRNTLEADLDRIEEHRRKYSGETP
jgi:hypothetical protein